MKNKRGNVVVIAIISVIVAITAGIVGWMFAKKSQAPVVKTQPTTQPIVPTDETASWQTYKSEELGIELRYPSGLIVRRDAPDPEVKGVSFSKNGSLPLLDAIMVARVSGLPDLDKLIQQKVDAEIVSGVPVTYIVDGINGVQIIEKAPVPQYEVFIRKSNFTYIFSVSNESAQLDDFKKILSTLKFIN